MWESSSASYSPVRRGSPSPSSLQQWVDDGGPVTASPPGSVGSPGANGRARSAGRAGSAGPTNRRAPQQRGPRSGSPSLQPVSRSTSADGRRRARARSDSPQEWMADAPRTRSLTEGAGVLGGSVGLPANTRSDDEAMPMPRLRSNSMDAMHMGSPRAASYDQVEESSKRRSLTDNDFKREGVLSMLGSGMLPARRTGSSVGVSSDSSMTARGKDRGSRPVMGGSVGVPGAPGMPLYGRPRSMTDGQVSRARSASPPEDMRLGRQESNHGDEYSYVPREGPLDGGTSLKYAPFDRTLDIEEGKESLMMTEAASAGPVSERDISLYRLAVLGGGWGFCCIAWLLGITLPSARLDVMPGTSIHWSMTRSLIHTLSDLTEKKLYISLLALGFFSVVVPAAKLGGTFKVIYEIYSKPVQRVFEQNRYLLSVLSYLASYQFVDLYVGILFVCYFNSDASEAKFQIGFYWFFSYCIISLAVSVLLEGTIYLDTPGTDERQSEMGPWATSLLGSQSRAEGQASARLQGFEGRAAEATDSNNPQELSIEHNMRESGYLPGPNFTDGKSPSLETFPDMITTRFFCIFFFVPLLIACFQPFLEVRMLLHQVAVERTVLSLKEIMCDQLPRLAHPVVVTFMWLFNGLCPVLYGAALIVRVEHRHRHNHYSETEWREERFSVPWFSRLASEAFRQWAHLDVSAIACLIFLFMIQDNDTLTMTPDGSFAFYIFLAAGFSFFFLRWFSEHQADDKMPWSRFMGLTCRSATLLVSYFAVCIFLMSGIPGQAPHYQYRTLSSVCRNAQPFLAEVSQQLPASYGNCDDKDSKPPQPCMGHENLQTSEHGDDRMNAIWMGGLRTLTFDDCQLMKLSDYNGQSRYALRVGGTFDKINMFLRVKTCPPIGGCITMNSADHCCGRDIGFNFTFELFCKPDPQNNAIRAIDLKEADLDPMLVKQKLLGGAVKVQAMDISHQVESSVKGHIKSMLNAKIKWGAKKLGVADMLNKIVEYNAPNQAGTCY